MVPRKGGLVVGMALDPDTGEYFPLAACALHHSELKREIKMT